MPVFVLVECVEGQVKPSCLDALGYAASLGSERVVGGVLGTPNAEAKKQLGAGGCTELWLLPQTQDPAQLVQTLYEEIKKEGDEASAFDYFILPDGLSTHQMGVLLAEQWGSALLNNVVDLPTREGYVKRSVYTGKAFEYVKTEAKPMFLSVKKNAAPRQRKGDSVPKERELQLSGNGGQARPSLKILSEERGQADISLPEADIVVSGGRGMKGPENWHLIETLAQLLGAATGCSKPVSDMGWRGHHEHVGQTGIKVAPSLYVAIGISGAIQHLAGVNNSKIIVVINKDPEAPFFKSADYGIVGDVFEVVPKLIETLKS